MLAMAAAILPVGVLGDRYGRKTMPLGALALFGASSAAAVYAPSAGAFIGTRVVLGLAGAGIMVLALSVITVLFGEEERPRAVGAWGRHCLPVGGGWAHPGRMAAVELLVGLGVPSIFGGLMVAQQLHSQALVESVGGLVSGFDAALVTLVGSASRAWCSRCATEL